MSNQNNDTPTENEIDNAVTDTIRAILDEHRDALTELQHDIDAYTAQQDRVSTEEKLATIKQQLAQ